MTMTVQPVNDVIVFKNIHCQSVCIYDKTIALAHFVVIFTVRFFFHIHYV